MQRARQQAVALGALLVPMLELGNHVELAAALGDDPLDRDVEVPDHAELAVQPFQLGPSAGRRPSSTIGEKKRIGGAQMRQCDPDLVQRFGIAAAGAVMLGEDGIEMTAGDDPEGGIAGHARR